MHVLIFSAFDPIPSDGIKPIRYARLADEFLKSGHTVTYITARFFHLTKSYRQQTSWSKDSSPKNLKLVLLDSPAYRSNVGLMRLLSYRKLAGSLLKFAKHLPDQERPNLIISANPPLTANLVLARWAKRKGIPFITDIQDAWPEAYKQFLPKALKWMLFPLTLQARNIIGLANAVAAVSEDYLRHYWKETAKKPTAVFYLGTNEFLILKPKHSKQNRIVYLGSAQTNSALVRAMEGMELIPDIELHIIGYLKAGSVYSKIIVEKGLKNSRYIEWEQFRKEGRSLTDYDAALVLTNPQSFIAFPNKTFAYLAAGLPLISNIQGGELQEIIAENNLGCTLTSYDPLSLEEAIRYSIEEFGLEDHERLQRFAKENFDSAIIYRKYCEWAMMVSNGNP